MERKMRSLFYALGTVSGDIASADMEGCAYARPR